MTAERSAGQGAPGAAADADARSFSRPSWLLALLALAAIAILIAEVESGWNVLHSTGLYSALAAKHYVWLNAVGVGLIVLAATVAPPRLRRLAVLAPAAVLLAVLIATAIPGGQFLAIVLAVLLMAALWDTGERLLRVLGASHLSQIAIVAWLAGIAPWALGITVLGRLSLVKWWTLGIALLVVGVIGAVRLGRRMADRRATVVAAVTASPLALVCCGVALLNLSWIAIYTAAPEIQFDALYAKAYLPELWARTGHISTILEHVQYSVVGWFQILATPGHLFDATAVGRYMQFVGLIMAVCTVWWWGRRHGALGPVAAAAVALTPILFWQASTADDDVLLAVAAFAFAVAITESLKPGSAQSGKGTAFALGLMGGTGASLKLHLVPLFTLLLLGWIVTGRKTRTAGKRLGYALIGAVVAAGPPLALRWIDAGNPVLPAYNNIFHSKSWLPVNETFNFPYWRHPGTFGPLRAIWKAIMEPQLMAEVVPPGAYGLLIAAVVLALLFGWAGRDRTRATRVLWIALIGAAVFWWVDFRYLRYLLPACFVAIALMVMVTSGVRLGRRASWLLLAAVAILAVAAFPVAVAQYWNVPTRKPPVYAAVGHWSEESYLSDGFTERPTILAFNRLSPKHARMISDAYERVWLRPERDLYSLHYEVPTLIELQGASLNGAQAFTALHKLGIEWAHVTGVDRHLFQPGYLSELLTAHGQPVLSEEGWDLYRLVPSPASPRALSACDAQRAGIGGCWGVPAGPALTTGVTRTVSACPGELLALSVQQAPGGPPTPLSIHFIGGNPATSVQLGEALPGSRERIYATAPPGTGAAQVTISPVAGGRIVSASLASVGRACPARA